MYTQEQIDSYNASHQSEDAFDKCINSLPDSEQILADFLNSRVHPTGAVRSKDADGTRFDLISPLFMEAVAKVLHEGSVKYNDHNWRKGFAWSECLNHLEKHINEFKKGDRSENHLAHAACNIMFLIEYAVTHPELNDLLTAEDYLPKEC